jgi:hypothetical protein
VSPDVSRDWTAGQTLQLTLAARGVSVVAA